MSISQLLISTATTIGEKWRCYGRVLKLPIRGNRSSTTQKEGKFSKV